MSFLLHHNMVIGGMSYRVVTIMAADAILFRRVERANTTANH